MTVDIEQRLASALDKLAAAYVPDVSEPDHGGGGSRRWVLSAAAALVAAIGIGGLALVAINDESGPVATAPPATDRTVTTTPADTTAGDPDESLVDDPGDSVMLATLPEEIGGPGEVTPSLQRWLYEAAESASSFAMLRSDTGTILDVVSWTVGPQSEWDKTFWDQPEAALPSGAVVKRLVPTLVPRVTYALQLDTGLVLIASSGVGYEQEMSRWFDAVLRPTNPDEVSGVEPPRGYDSFVSPLRLESVSYPPIGVSVTTAHFPADTTWDLESWARTDATVAGVTPIDGRDAVVAEHVEGIGPSVIARLESGLGVRLLGADNDELTSLLDSLVVREIAPGDIPERSDPISLPANDSSEPAVRGQVSLGRFFIVTSTDGQQSCQAFDSTFNGATSRCAPLSSSDPAPLICNSTGRLLPATGEWEQLATVITPTEMADSVGISIDGTMRTTTVEPVDSPDGDTGLSMVRATAITGETASVSFLGGESPLDCG